MPEVVPGGRTIRCGRLPLVSAFGHGFLHHLPAT
jgi:hypothetical protein